MSASADTTPKPTMNRSGVIRLVTAVGRLPFTTTTAPTPASIEPATPIVGSPPATAEPPYDRPRPSRVSQERDRVVSQDCAVGSLGLGAAGSDLDRCDHR